MKSFFYLLAVLLVVGVSISYLSGPYVDAFVEDNQANKLEAKKEKLIHHIMDSSVVVRLPNGNWGSGVLIKARDAEYVLTAGHVARYLRELDDDNNVSYARAKITQPTYDGVEFKGNRVAYARPVRVSDKQYSYDLALFKIIDENFIKDSISFSRKNAAVGTAVYHCGSMGSPSLGNSVTDGLISGVDRNCDGFLNHLDQISSPCLGGSSGGGVFNKRDGAVLGILVAGHTETVSFMVPTRSVMKWAKSNGVEFIFKPNQDTYGLLHLHPIEDFMRPVSDE